MIIRGGENVYPREIEEFLYRHPKVLEVAVVGVPSDVYGEEVCAWIRLRDGAACTALEIREFCMGQIAHYKIPQQVTFVDAFPTTVTGKVQKYLIRAEILRRLGAQQEPRTGLTPKKPA
jgi:fatty-acyl-CoA synthase